MDAIAVDRVSKRYGRGGKAVQALDDVSLHVQEGEIYGLLGRNGAGKTTLVKVLLDLVRPSSGEATLLGQTTRQAAARLAVGYLPEDHRLPDYQTAEGALRFYAALSGMAGASLASKARELLGIVGLTSAAKRKVRTFSKGMKQRLGLAQALVHEPRLLFLDEPTDGVDPVGRAEIRDVLVELKGRGVTVFLNSHLLSEVERLCDRVGILECGRLVREGTMEALTRTERVYTVGVDRPLHAAARALLAGLALSVADVDPATLELGLGQEADIDRVVDLLRGQGVGLRTLHAKRSSLEDVFLAAIRAEGEA